MRLVHRVFTGVAVLIAAGAHPANSVADLVNPGDLMFIGLNMDGGDDFAIVLLTNVAAGTEVHFNDNEWAATGFNGQAESELTWNVGGIGLAAGTVVTFNNMNNAGNQSVSVGTLSGGTMSLSGDDTVYAFLGPDAFTPSTFLAAISNSEAEYDPENPNNGTLEGTGLTLGTTALLLPQDGTDLSRGGQYIGPRSGASAFSDYVTLVGDLTTNWSTSTINGTQFVPFNTTSFQVATAAVPEPASLSLMFLAASVVAVRRRVKSQNRRTGHFSKT
ncbi:MAG: PEP-CTERM sorting domain-containing protein [Planctomycetaceae bacterium]|nr:PEP-CTERM sorting domain-containing protein [Planctomycetaceae bacterium]